MAEEEVSAEHRALICTLAQRHGMTEWQSPPGTLISVGDAETFFELVRDGGGIAFVETQRGHAMVKVRFRTVLDAVRFMVLELSDRFQVPSPAFAPGSAYAAAAEGEDRVLTWPGGRAVSPGGRLDPERAREFSWVATVDPADIAARRIPILKVTEPD
jgi:hypothetical protein